MAELSEVLALRMQNSEQQQREAAQLRAQVTKLQQCCQAVRRGVCGAPCSCHGPMGPTPPSPCPHPMELRGPRPLSVSESVLEETSERASSCPLVPSWGPSPKRDTGCSRKQAT